jgi:ubiquinone/menaquinone biosynthesis C-methylase UbiE
MSDISHRVRDAYDNWAEVYNTDENKTRDLNAGILKSFLTDIKKKRILEIGCGTGINSEYFARHAESLTGIDISEKMLNQARKRVRHSNAVFLNSDITRPWQFEDQSFDVISANLVLEHIEDLSHIYNEAFRVLDQQGLLYIAELHPFRQLNQSQARFTHQKTGELILVDAFLHPISEYLNEAISSGFLLIGAGEHQTEDDKLPRLLTLLFQKS